MKRKLLLLCLCLCVSILPLMAESRSGIGYGSNREEAMISAQVDLSRTLKVSMTSVSGDDVRANSYGVSYDQFSESTLFTTSFPFIDLKWDYVKEKKGRWEAKCSIDSSQKNLYKSEYDSVCSTINELYPIYKETTDPDRKLEICATLVDALQSYDGLRTILNIIASDMQLSVPVYTSYTAMSNIYRSELEKAKNSISADVGEDMDKERSDFSNEVDWLKYATQVENFKNYSRLSENERKRAESNLYLSSLDVVTNLRKALENNDRQKDLESFDALDKNNVSWHINRITGCKERFTNSKNNIRNAFDMLYASYDAAVMEIDHEIDQSLTEKVASSDYRISDKVWELKAKERENLLKKYKKEGDKLYKEGFESLKKITKEAEGYIKTLNKSKFTVDSDSSSSIALTIDSFIEDRAVFSGYATLIVGSMDCTFDVEIPYEAITGEKYVEADDIYEYSAQLQLIDGWLGVLKNTYGLLSISTEFTVSTDPQVDAYWVEIQKYEIRNNSTGKRIHKSSRKQGKAVYGEYKVNLDDYYHLTDTGLLADERNNKKNVGDYSSYEAAFANTHGNMARGMTEKELSIGAYGTFFIPEAGVIVDMTGWGFSMGASPVFPLNIGNIGLFPAAWLGLYMHWPFQDLSEKAVSFGGQAGLMLYQMVGGKVIDNIGAGVMVDVRSKDPYEPMYVKVGAQVILNTPRVGLGLFLRSGNLIDKLEFWESPVDFAFMAGLTL